MADLIVPETGCHVHMPSLDGFGASGVYFLYQEGRVVYVGQAVNVRKRVGNHIGEGVKSFDVVSFIPCRRDQLNAIERKYIALLGPKYNDCGIARDTRLAAGFAPLQVDAPITVDRMDRRKVRRQKAIGVRLYSNGRTTTAPS